MPPQARPTLQAVSSVTPKRSRSGRPVERQRNPLSTTAASTQPPLTEPAIFPPAVSAIADPAGRGAEPHVWMTVAIATRSPDSRQRSTSSRMSLIGLGSLYLSPMIAGLAPGLAPDLQSVMGPETDLTSTLPARMALDRIHS